MAIEDQIKEQIQANKVVLFMKGTPDAPLCRFSKHAVEMLRECGADVAGVNVLENPELRQAMKDFSQWPTFPQLYINGEFIGGCDIMVEMYNRGELQTKLSSS